MSDKPKPRWYQFSLKALFVLTTVACGAAAITSLVARLRHFQQEAVFHRSQIHDFYFPSKSQAYVQNYHREAILAYEQATYRPWLSPSFSRVPPKPPPEIPPSWVEMESIYDEMGKGPADSAAPVPNPPKNKK